MKKEQYYNIAVIKTGKLILSNLVNDYKHTYIKVLYNYNISPGYIKVPNLNCKLPICVQCSFNFDF